VFLESPPPRSEPVPDPLPLAIRAAALGIIAAALLVVLLFRLWALQVLHAGQYSTAAVQSQVRTSVVPARRGDIVDRHGNILVSSRTAIAVQVNSATFPADTDCSGLNRHDHKLAAAQPGCLTLWRLAGVIKQPFPRVWKEYSTRLAANRGYPITLPFTVTRPEVAYMLERHDRFPSIQFQRTFVRDYPALDAPAIGAINPNLIGHVGPITAENLKDPAFRGENLPQTGTAGQAGIEKSYDGWLRGSDGETAQMFDASGQPVRSPYLVREPVTGSTVRLTLDAHLQKVAQDAIYRGMQIAHADRQYYANYGSVVAINPENGAIYAMASYPTYKPTVWVPPYDGQGRIVDPKNPLFPQVDKSYAGTYPPGSTFKPITAVAAWMSGLIGPGSTRPCTTVFQSPNDFSHHKFFNWGPENSIIGLSKALEISCDTFFYRLGDQFYDRFQTGSNIFQQWIRKLGYGDPPPIDIPGAVGGLVPDQHWKAHNPLFVNGPNPSIDTLWEPGDDIQMAIGQGYLLVSPLQQAVAYSVIENGGKVVTPHLMQSVTGPDGSLAAGANVASKPQRDLHLPAELLAEIKSGLYGATHAGDGTSTSTFGNFQPTVYGKTGTAEVPQDCTNCSDAWWAGWAEQGGHPLVVVAMIHDGGHGGVSAAPVAAEIFAAFFHSKYLFQSGQDQSR
jgi:penicillin-binding protein 2